MKAYHGDDRRTFLGFDPGARLAGLRGRGARGEAAVLRRHDFGFCGLVRLGVASSQSSERLVIWRSIWAVFAGVLLIIVVTTIVDVVLHAVGASSNGQRLTDSLAMLATAYRVVITVRRRLADREAPRRLIPMRHALILGAVGTVLGLAGLIKTWNPRSRPALVSIALVVIAIPQCWLGGKLYERRAAAKAQGLVA